MSDAPKTIDLCYFSVDARIGEPAVLVEEDFGGPFEVKHGVEFTRLMPGKKGKEYRSSLARLGKAQCQLHNGRIIGYVWDLADRRDDAAASLFAKVRDVLAEEIRRFQSSLDGLTIQSVERECEGPRP